MQTERLHWQGLVRYYGLRVVCISILLFLALPLLMLVPVTLGSGHFAHFPPDGLTLEHLGDLFRIPAWRNALAGSLVLAVFAAVGATFIGTAAALGLYHRHFRGRRFLVGLSLAPLLIPTIVWATALHLWLRDLGFGLGWFGTWLGHITLGIPFVVLITTYWLRHLRRELFRAAATLGADPYQVLRTVTLPLILPGVGVAAIVVFVLSIGEVVINLTVGTQSHTLAVNLFQSFASGSFTPAAAAALVILTLSVASLIVADLLHHRGERSRETLPQNQVVP